MILSTHTTCIIDIMSLNENMRYTDSVGSVATIQYGSPVDADGNYS